VVHQGQELVARGFAVAEGTQHGAGHGAGVLLLDAAHHHAEVASFADDANTQGIDAFLDALRHLLCQALLDLQAASEGIDNPRDFAEPD
jgi:hypothetical protein